MIRGSKTLLGAASTALLFLATAHVCVSAVRYVTQGKTPEPANGRFLLEIDGTHAGWLLSVEGAPIAPDSAPNAKIMPSAITIKQAAAAKVRPLSFVTGGGLSNNFLGWLQASINGTHSRKDGSIHACDYDGKIQSTIEFHQALISEVGFPACDAGSKDAAKLNVKFAPEFTRYKKGSGKITPEAVSLRQKTFHPTNFRLAIDGLDCSPVTHVDAVVLKLNNEPAQGRAGFGPEYGKLERPTLSFLVPAVKSKQFADWLAASSKAQGAKNASLSFMGDDAKPFIWFEYGKVSPMKVSPVTDPQGKGSPALVKVELVAESLKFNFRPH